MEKTKEQLKVELNKLKQEIADIKSGYDNPNLETKVKQEEKNPSLEDYELIFESARDGIVYVDQDTIILNVNKAFTEITGISRDKIIGRPGFELAKKYLNSPKTNDVLALIKKIIANPEIHTYEIKSNEKIFEITSRQLTSGHRVAVIRDITKRKQVENALSQTENRLYFLAENAQDMLYRMSIPDGNYEYVSPASLALYGYTPQEFYASPLLIQKSMHPDWTDYFKKEWKKLVKGVMPPDYEYKIIHKSGKVKWLHQRNVLLKDDKGKPVAIEGIVSDITKTKHDQEAISQSEIKYRSLFEKSADAMFIINKSKIIDCNLATLDMLKCQNKQEILNIHPSEISPEFQEDGRKSLEKGDELMRKAYASGNLRFEWIHKRRNGELFPAEALLTVVHIGEENMLHVVLRDITDRKNAEKILQNREWYYRVLFENSPVPLWEEDFSEIKKEIDKLIKKGIKDFKKYFDNNPQKIADFVKKVKILEVNKAALALHGANSKNELLDGLDIIFTQSSLEAFTYNLIAIANGNKSAEFDGIVKKLNGEEISIHLIWVLVPGYEDSMRKVFVSTIDISERVNAEESLRQQVHFNDLLLQSISDGYVLSNDKGKIINVNPAYCQMVQYEREELLQKNVYDLDVHFEQKEIIERTKRFKQYGTDKFETTQKCKNGALIDFEVSATAIQNSEGKFAASFMRDITERKKAESELKESEQKLRNIFENSSNLFYAHTTDHKLIYLSPQIKDILGYSEKEALVKWTTLVTDNPINEKGYQYTQEAILSGKKQAPYKLELFKKTGEKIWVEVREVPIVKNGKTTLIVGALIDITDRMNAEKAILKRETMLIESQKVSQLGSYELDFSTGFWESTEVLLELLGIDKSYKTNVNGWLKLIHPDDREMMENYFSENILKKSEPFNKEYRIVRVNDKKERWVLGLGRLEFDNKGTPLKLIGTIQDITDRKLIDNALMESENKYRTLIENSNDAIYLLYNNKFDVINNKFTEMFGYTIDEINKPGFGYKYLVAPKSQPIFMERQEQFEKGKIETNKYEITLLTRNGKEVEVEISDTFIKYKKGIANQGFIRDITARKKQQEILMNAIVKVQEDEKYKFGKELHDGLGQVLISESMYLQSLGKIKSHLNDSKKSDLEQAQKLNKQAIVDARRISHGLMITGIDEHGILHLIKQLCYNSGGPEINFRFIHKNIDETKISSEFKMHIYRIVQELSTNILKHSRATKAIIKMIMDNGMIKLSVSDNGQGFEVENTTKGAGLPNIDQRITIMKGIKKLHTKKGEGTQFTISIPV